MDMIIVFSDLDGTLLDKTTYSWEEALPGLSLLKQHGIPLVFCTSKTKPEIEYYREKLSFDSPFISENGGAIFIPKNYFEFEFEYNKRNDYYIIELGKPYSELREVLAEVKREVGCNIIGFGDMSVEDICKDCGLPAHLAELSKQKDYDEAFKIEGNEGDVNKVLALIKEKGYNYTIGTRYYHIMGANDKGKAVKILTRLFNRKYKSVKTIGIGDSLNDVPMLEVVDVPVLVMKQDGGYEKIELNALYRAPGIGPAGWSMAIKHLIKLYY